MRNSTVSSGFGLVLFFSTLLAACSQELETARVDTVQSNQPVDAAPGPEWKAPAHPRMESYSQNYSAGGTVGRFTTWGDTDWSPGSKGSKLGGGAGHPGEPLYSSMLEYTGTLAGRDYYNVTVSYPTDAGTGGFTRTFEYEGEDLEFWSDDDWRIGMRPSSDSSEGK